MDPIAAIILGLVVVGLVSVFVYLWRNRAFEGGGDPEVADEMYHQAGKNPNRIFP